MATSVVRALLAGAMVFAVAGCTNETDSTESPDPTSSGTNETVTVSGHAGSASLAGAQLRVFDSRGEGIAVAESDANAAFTVDVPADAAFPVKILANGGQDLVTAKPIEIELMAIAESPEIRTLQVSPISTLAAHISDCAGRSWDQNEGPWPFIRANFSLGLDQSIDPLRDPVTVGNAAELVLANETLREILRRALQSYQGTGSQLSPDDILRQVSCDLGADGVLDGIGNGVDQRLTAVIRAAEAGVLLERIVGRMQVEGQDGSPWLNQALQVVTGSTEVSIEDATISPELIAQAEKALMLFAEDFAPLDFPQIVMLMGEEPAIAAATLSDALDTDRQNTLRGLTDQVALSDVTTINSVIQKARQQPDSEPPIVSLAVSSTAVEHGQTVELSWSSARAYACQANGDWQGSRPVEGVFTTEPLEQTSSFRLRCSGPGGTVEKSVQIAVTNSLAEVSVTLDADARTLAAGDTTVLRWRSVNATACTAGGDWAGAKAVIGREPTDQLSNTSTFTLTCTNGAESASDSVTVNVTPVSGSTPLVGLSADRTEIGPGQSFTLTWTSRDADYCRASGAWTGDRSPNGSEHIDALSASSVFHLTCFGNGGANQASVAITTRDPQTPPPALSLTASQTKILAGQTVDLTWQSSDAESCTASGAWQGDKNTNGHESTGPIQQDTTFTLHCSGPGGSVSASATVNVEPAAAPTLILRASESVVDEGVAPILIWQSTNAERCYASGGWDGPRDLAGSAMVDPLASRQTYEITCAGAAGSVSASVTIEIRPVLTLRASPSRVALGQSTEISWSARHADRCIAADGWAGAKPIAGAETFMPTATSTLKLTCTGPGGSATQSTALTVSAPEPPPIVSLLATGDTVEEGGKVTLSWHAEHATTCTAAGGWSGAQATAGSTDVGPITIPTTYTLVCEGVSGTASSNVNIAIRPIVTLTADTSITAGDTARLSWATRHADVCTATGAWTGNRPVSGSEQFGSLDQTSSFALRCSGIGGSTSATTTIQVEPAPVAPTVVLQAAQSPVADGQNAVLTWNSTGTDDCAASGAWSGSRGTSGAENSRPLNQTSVFTIACTGSGGEAIASVTVDVAPRPDVTITANPAVINSGESTTLTWSASNADDCFAGGAWSGTKTTSGTQQTQFLNTTSGFSLTCVGPGGQTVAQADVQVNPLNAPEVLLSADTTNIAPGDRVTLSWAVTDADSCVASGGWSGEQSTRGSTRTDALNASTTYALTCTGAGGQSSSSVDIVVTPPPEVALSVDEPVVNRGESTTLNWSTTHADTCTASGGWSGAKATAGSERIGPNNQPQTYTLTCTGASGTALTSLSVGVNGSLMVNWQAPTKNTDGSPLTDLAGYKLLYGELPGSYTDEVIIDDPAATSLTLTLPVGTYFLVMRAIDLDGDESADSNELQRESR